MIPNMTTEEKQSHMTNFMTGIIGRLNEGFEVDTVAEYAVEFVKIWGRTEAQKQIRAMIKDTEESRRFCALVNELVRNN